MAEYRLKLIGAWEAAYLRDTRELQRQVQELRQSPKSQLQSSKYGWPFGQYLASGHVDPCLSYRGLCPLSRDLVSLFQPARDLSGQERLGTLCFGEQSPELHPQNIGDTRPTSHPAYPEAFLARCPYKRPKTGEDQPRLDLISLAHKSHTESEATPLHWCWASFGMEIVGMAW